MAVKILAVDDSATMRQILEMTFAGEDAEVTTVESGQQAVDAASRLQPDVVLADASMAGMDGYAVAQKVKANGVNAAVVILSSQHVPYDEAKGKAAGVDDHVAKPFDSQVVIDKVTQLAAARPAAARPPVTAPGPAAATPAQPAQPAAGRVSKRTMAFGTSPVAPPQPPTPRKPPAAPAPAKRPVLELADEPDIEIEEAPARPAPARPAPARPAPAAPAPAKPAAAAPPAKPAPARPAPAAAAPAAAKPAAAKPAPAKPAAAPAAAATASGGAMAKKLGDLGLSKEQVEAVLALSREVVEQVVWEVVPDLAETLIKEEIARLTEE